MRINWTMRRFRTPLAKFDYQANQKTDDESLGDVFCEQRWQVHGLLLVKRVIVLLKSLRKP